MIRMTANIILLFVSGVPSLAYAQPAPVKTDLPQADIAQQSRASDLGYLTADQLSRRCAQSDAASISYCFAYIAAVTDTARAYEIWLNAKEFCLPPNVAQGETRRAFITYLGAYPTQGSGQAASVVVNALKQTYPCD